ELETQVSKSPAKITRLSGLCMCIAYAQEDQMARTGQLAPNPSRTDYQRNPLVSSTTRRQGQRGCRPFPLHPQSPPDLLRFASDHPSRTISLDEAEHFLHNHHASVASLRLLFTFTPERRSASLRNRCSPSPEYPPRLRDSAPAPVDQRSSWRAAWC